MPNHSMDSTFGENEPSLIVLSQTLSPKTLCLLTLRRLVFQEGILNIHFSYLFPVFL